MVYIFFFLPISFTRTGKMKKLGMLWKKIILLMKSMENFRTWDKINIPPIETTTVWSYSYCSKFFKRWEDVLLWMPFFVWSNCPNHPTSIGRNGIIYEKPLIEMDWKVELIFKMLYFLGPFINGVLIDKLGCKRLIMYSMYI